MMNVGRVLIRAVPRLTGGETEKAVYKYQTQINWLDSETSFMMKTLMETKEAAAQRGVDMLNWLRDTYGEDYTLV